MCLLARLAGCSLYELRTRTRMAWAASTRVVPLLLLSKVRLFLFLFALLFLFRMPVCPVLASLLGATVRGLVVVLVEVVEADQVAFVVGRQPVLSAMAARLIVLLVSFRDRVLARRSVELLQGLACGARPRWPWQVQVLRAALDGRLLP